MEKVITFLFLNFVFAYAQPNRYVIYNTENIWNSLELDSKTGQVKQISSNPPLQIEIVPKIVTDSEKVRNAICYPFLYRPAAWCLPAVNGRYKLYKTENLWNFLLLDTYTGMIYQVQFSTDSLHRAWWPINEQDLRKDKTLQGSNFYLKETGNIWTFDLIDNSTGDVWIVQFSVQDDKYRWIQKAQ